MSGSFFVWSKWLGGAADPANILAVLILASGGFLLLRRRRFSALLLTLAVLLVLAVAVLPIPVWLTRPLEQRFPPPKSLPEHVDGIIALGGTQRVEVSAAWRQPIMSDPTPIAALVSLARRYPGARLVFSGGQHARDDRNVSEATVVADFLAQLGSDASRIVYEDRSRNTYENATLSYALLQPKPGERWILVTQAISMPRAVAVFRKAGWSVIAYPAGYLTSRDDSAVLGFDLLGGLHLSAVALHEWVGLFVYRFMGYTDEVLPE